VNHSLQPVKANHSGAQFPQHVYTQPIGRLDPFDELDGKSHQQKFQEIIPKFKHHSRPHRLSHHTAVESTDSLFSA
ncbi:hypothetical protein, partial [Salmonella sp. SAL4447]|uniref:hypothetical protein n=1 Tax=Salmonella sp. SAL4447 TaxID=3159902 RepID=UPI00397DE28F